MGFDYFYRNILGAKIEMSGPRIIIWYHPGLIKKMARREMWGRGCETCGPMRLL